MTPGATATPNDAGTAAPPRPIAVVTVCKNPGGLLAGAIDSVRALGDPRIRHIVIDGASVDGTPAYLASIESALHFWRSEPDRGIYDAMNKGWAAAPADAWVIFIGADDRLLSVPSAGELLRYERDRCGVVYGTTRMGTVTFRSRFGPEIRFRNTLHHQSLLVRKDVHPEPPFEPAYRIYGDWDFNLRLWRDGIKASPCKTLLADAAPLGISAVQPLRETFLIASRHSGWPVGALAWAMAAGSRVRRGATRTLRDLPARFGSPL